MATERPTTGFGTRIEPQSIEGGTTPWDRASIESVIGHFGPVLEELRPLAVYLHLSEDSDAHEPGIAVSRRRGRNRLPSFDLLSVVTFANATGVIEDELKMHETADLWVTTSGKGGQELRVKYYKVPFPTTLSSESIDTLEKAHDFFNINPETHEQIYPPQIT